MFASTRFIGTQPASIALSALPVPSGPLSGLLQAARDELVGLAAGRGVALSVEFDMPALVRVNEAAVAAGSWEPMLPAAHPACRSLTPANAFWICGRAPSGDVVTAQAGLLYDCTTQSIGDRFNAMTVFYDEPAVQAPEGEWCTCTSDTANGTRGQVVWTNAGWTRPDFQGRGLFPICQRVNKLAAWLLWSPTWFISVVDPDIVPVWAERKMGPRHIDDEPAITYNQIGLKTLPMHLVRFSRAQFLGDLAQLAADLAQAA
ncbi:hypothetical protein Sp245p_20520 (plasmid) [Azospirillum baldaniorum]|uniref:Uncharacterized protein n=1 Tax=Azospirillum baldaniorum TaxID=1064539 RepID=A0A9P1JVN1_9PROT|nr:hypothetical protein [Azospirillum baldaniorum]TWA73572.1 hypothetical protein FBZ85_11527 [Azospirillum brasilense]AWJ92164.1 hypothetical protein Sp245p_20520 [Azospirillum baldaniorum]NUB08582.1 hypothetical protein [Azospirillum baldaniorum]TWA58635.1 hypothetical protein FBZ84_11726 [Azospirillum baldaniorum]CCD00647.1 conserved exported protein of unknown function [Azospirillum baldaniorum]